MSYFYSASVEQVDFEELDSNIRGIINQMVAMKTDNSIPDFMQHDHLPNYPPPMVSFGGNYIQVLLLDRIFSTTAATFFLQAEFVDDISVEEIEMNFINLPSRSRRLVKVPAMQLSAASFLVGFEESLQVTIAAVPFKKEQFCLVLILPGKPSDYIAGGLSKIESKLNNETWSSMMRALQPISGLVLQLPVINHRSTIY